MDSESNPSLLFPQAMVNQGLINFPVSTIYTINKLTVALYILVLPLHVRKEGEEMLEVCTNLKDDSSVSTSIILPVDVKYSLQAVMIEQYNLDIEQWMSNCVESLLSAEQRFRLSQLVDYDVQLVEVHCVYIYVLYIIYSNVFTVGR